VREAATMAEWEAKEGENGEIIVRKKPPPPVPYENVKAWIGGMVVFSLIMFFLVMLIRDWFG
jgi:hypothetical protein